MERFILFLILLDMLLLYAFGKRDRAFIVPILIAGATAAFQAVQAGKQRRQARKLKQSTSEPPALKEASESARREAMSTRYAGQDVDEANLRQTVTDAFHNVARSSSSPATTLNAASNLAGFQQRGQQQIGQQAARFRRGAADTFRQVQMRRAGVQEGNRRQFEAAKSALIGASQQNMFNAFSSLGAGAVQHYSDQQAKKGGYNPYLYNPYSRPY